MSYGRYLLGIQIELRHKEILDRARPCVFISNHQDNLDIFPGVYTLPQNTVTKRAFETMDAAANAIKEKKLSVWIMPEGTRSKGRGVLPFKKGPFITAIKAQVPIVPIAISSYTKHLDIGRWKTGKIIVKVFPPIPTIGLTIEDVNDLLNQSYQVIKNGVLELDNEIEKTIVKKV